MPPVADDAAQDIAAALFSPQAETEYGFDGGGVKIGIISDSFDQLGGEATDVAAGRLPDGVSVLRDGSGEDEGRALAQVIHAIAPGAQLYFETAEQTPSGIDGTAQAVSDFDGSGVRIVADDVEDPGSNLFQAGSTVQNSIATAIAGGMSWFQSAGNGGLDYYTGILAPEAATVSGQAVTANLFSPSGTAPTDLLPISTSPYLDDDGDASLVVQWDEPAGAAGQEVVPVLVTASGTVVGDVDPQPLPSWNHDAVTEIDFTGLKPDTAYGLMLLVKGDDADAAAGIPFRIYSHNQEIGFSGSSDAPGADSSAPGNTLVAGEDPVGEVFYTRTPQQGVAIPTLSAETSGGPVSVPLSASGTTLATPTAFPGNSFAAPTDGLTSIGFGQTPDANGLYPFYGTSAASAAAAGVAALCLSADPDLTNADLTHLLDDSAVVAADPYQFLRPGFTGAGLIQADIAVADAATHTVSPFDDDAANGGAPRDGNTTVYGTHEGDTFHADDRPDTFVVEGGSNTIDGNGFATLSYADISTGVLVDLASGTADDAGSTDRFSGVSALVGSNHGDTIVGGNNSQLISTGTGSNQLFLSNGADTVSGGGDDEVVCGAGNATVSAAGPFSTVFGGGGTLQFTAGAGAATVVGGSGAALVSGGESYPGNTTLFAGNGSTFLFSGVGNETLVGGAGPQTVQGGGIGDDQLVFGNSGPCTVIARSGTQVVVPGGGALDVQVTYGDAGGVVDLLGYEPTRDSLSFSGFSGAAIATTTHYGGTELLTLTDDTRIWLVSPSGS